MPLDPHFPPLLAQLEAGGWLPLMDGRPATQARARYREMSLLRRGAGYTPEPVADVEDQVIAGPGGELPVRVYRDSPAADGGGRPDAADPQPVVVWLHGGGWVLGDLDTIDPVCRRVVTELGAVVVSVDYRLAPEHPHPAALEDTMAALRWAASRWPDAPLVVAGDSAGGGLAAGAALRARDEGGPPLAAQLLVYPALDPAQTQPSVRANGEGPFLTAQDMRRFYAAYVPGELAADPAVALLTAPRLAGLPPAVVATAEFDPLRDEGDRYAERLAAAGVPVNHLPGPGLVHGYFALGEIAPAAAVRRDEVLDALAAATRPPEPAAQWPPTEPGETTLTSGPAHLAVDLRGGGLRRLVVGGWEVLDGYPAGGVPAGRRGGVLLPWPNRLRAGRWRWRGRDLQLDIASPKAANAIHGLVSWQPWTVLAGEPDRATVGTTIEPRPGYPFRLAAAIDYVLTAQRLSVTVRVRNLGPDPAPFGAGMHPYLQVGLTPDGDGAGGDADGEGGLDDAELSVPARTALETDGGLPTGVRLPFHGGVDRIGDRLLDTPLTDLVRDEDGWARLRLRGAAGELVLAVDAAWPWLQVYSGDTLPAGQRRRSLAVEPMTCPPNALADGVDLVVLESGASWAGTWTLSWTPAP